MSILHSQLAIFGAIDALVVEARKGYLHGAEQRLLDAAEKLMPNTTGFGEAGWFTELESFFNRETVRRSEAFFAFPALPDAAAELGALRQSAGTEELGSTAFSRQVSVLRDSTQAGGFEDQTPLYSPEYDPALARAGYGAFVLRKLNRLLPEDVQNATGADLDAVLATSLAAYHADAGITATISAELDGIDTRQQWTTRVEELIGDGAGELYAHNSKPCFGSLQLINGRYCSTVVTDARADDLSVHDIERVFDPMNWSICSKFFCTMHKNVPNRNKDSWSRVQETIGAECAEYGLTTDLVFFKARHADGGIFMNYDIDPERHIDPASGDQGYVEVDNGYIWVSPLTPGHPGDKGVRIRTSKQEHVNGLSPCATAALACLMGWADAGKDMIAGTARRLIAAEKKGDAFAPLKTWYPSNVPDPAEMET